MITSVGKIVVSPVAEAYWILILDSDMSVSSLSKTGNIKSFLLSNNVLEFKGIINSLTFNPNTNQPINDINLNDNMVMVTIGNYGLGYGWLADKVGDAVLTNINSIELKKADALKNILLDNSILQQVKVLSIFSGHYRVLVTSSKSLPLVITLVNNNNVF